LRIKDALPDSPLAATYYSPAKDALRQRVNDWIRTTDSFDAVLDFDAVLRDAQDPLRLRSVYDSGDYLHPGDAGNQAMAAAVQLDTLIGDAK
jgi:lysophospholipase L1-like esterase